MRSRAREVERAFSELEHRFGRSPTDEELSDELGTGHGARLRLTLHTTAPDPAPDLIARAGTALSRRVRAVAARIAGATVGTTVED